MARTTDLALLNDFVEVLVHGDVAGALVTGRISRTTFLNILRELVLEDVSPALAADADIYPNTSAGLTATAEGGYFYTEGTGDTALILYREVGGVAVEKSRLSSAAALEAAVAAIAALQSGKVPTTRTIGSSGLLTGGGDLSANRTLSVPIASGTEVNAASANDKAVTPAGLAGMKSRLDGHDVDLAGKVTITRQVNGGGLVTGGGGLNIDRTLTVTAASTAEVAAGTENGKVVTPAALKPQVDRIATAEAAIVAVDAKASGALALVAPYSDLVGDAHDRPGDAQSLFTSVLTGDPRTRMPIAAGVLASGVLGRALRIRGEDTDPGAGFVDVAPRKIFNVARPGRTYAVVYGIARAQDPVDPEQNAVELRLQNMNGTFGSVSNVRLGDPIAPTVAAGGQYPSFLIGKAGAPGTLAYTIPPTSLYITPHARIFGNGQQTDVGLIDLIDVTDEVAGGADIGSIISELAARVTAVEGSVATKAEQSAVTAEIDNRQATGPSPVTMGIALDRDRIFVPNLVRANGIVSVGADTSSTTLFNTILQWETDTVSLASPQWLGLDYSVDPPVLAIKKQQRNPQGASFGVIAKRLRDTITSPVGLPLMGPQSSRTVLRNQCPAGKNNIENAIQWQPDNPGTIVNIAGDAILGPLGYTKALSAPLLGNNARYALYGGPVADGRAGQKGFVWAELMAPADNAFASPRVVVKHPGYGAGATHTLIKEVYRRSNRIAVFAGQFEIAAGVVGTEVLAGSVALDGSDVRVLGVRYAMGADPYPWVAEDDFTVPASGGVSSTSLMLGKTSVRSPILMGKEIFTLGDRPRTIYPNAVMGERTEGSDLVAAFWGLAPADPIKGAVLNANSPSNLTARGSRWTVRQSGTEISFNPLALGATATLAIRVKSEGQPQNRKVRKFAHSNTNPDTLDGATLNMLALTDSLGDSHGLLHGTARIFNDIKGFTAKFWGTKKSDERTTNTPTPTTGELLLAEMMGGRRWSEITHEKIAPGVTFQPLPPGQEAAYLAMSEGQKRQYNVFVRQVVPADPAAVKAIAFDGAGNVDTVNGYVFDFAFFLNRWAGTDLGAIPLLDFILICLGTNDLSDFINPNSGDPTDWRPRIDRGLKILCDPTLPTSMAAACPGAWIGIVTPQLSRSAVSDARWTSNHRDLITKILAYVTAANRTTLKALEANAYVSPEAAWWLTPGAVDDLGSYDATNTDHVHMYETSRAQIGDAVAAMGAARAALGRPALPYVKADERVAALDKAFDQAVMLKDVPSRTRDRLLWLGKDGREIARLDEDGRLVAQDVGRGIWIEVPDGTWRWAVKGNGGRILRGQRHDGSLYDAAAPTDAGGTQDPSTTYLVDTVGVSPNRYVVATTPDGKELRLSPPGVDAYAPASVADGVIYAAKSFGVMRRRKMALDFNSSVSALVEIIHHLLINGQSLSLGLTSPPREIEAERAYISGRTLMYNGGIRTLGNSMSSADLDRVLFDEQIRDFVDVAERLDQGGGETPWSRCVHSYATALGAAAAVLVSCHGISGQAYAKVKKGTQQYENLLLTAQATVAKSTILGKGVVFDAGIINGEADRLMTEAQFAATLLEYHGDLETDLLPMSGQVRVRLFTDQFSAWSDSAMVTCEVQLAQLKTALANPTKIFCVGPKYHLEYSTDGTHLTRRGNSRLGRYWGRAMAWEALTGQPWKPLHAVAASRSGAVVTIDAHVPQGPLVIDTEWVSNPADDVLPAGAPSPGMYGVTFSQTGGNAVTVDDVTVSGSQIIVTLSEVPTGTAKKIGFGMIGISGRSGGPTAGPRCCIRDSSPDTDEWGAPLYNPMSHNEVEFA